ncbi:hypothetical protein WJX72_002164 [[Myrmecia] bisecta]|uniref:Smr domain-containing protein n=1 Tax=[Myrmecia] bisecta TaxID=41462 RepID=A0AAW1R5L9_9CHLO
MSALGHDLERVPAAWRVVPDADAGRVDTSSDLAPGAAMNGGSDTVSASSPGNESMEGEAGLPSASPKSPAGARQLRVSPWDHAQYSQGFRQRWSEICVKLRRLVLTQPQHAREILRKLAGELGALENVWPGKRVIKVVAQALVDAEQLDAAVACAQHLPVYQGLYYRMLLHLVSKQRGRSAGSVAGVRAVHQALRKEARLQGGWPVKVWKDLVLAFARLNRPRETCQAFDDLCSLGLWDVSKVLMANSVLNMLTDDFEAIMQRYQQMKAAGFVGDQVTFNTLLKACMRCADADAAERVYQEMRGLGIQGDEFTYNTLIKACSYAGDLPRALAVRELMAEAGFEPPQSIWGSLITACGKAGQSETAFALWADIRQGRPAPSVLNYNALLNVCAWTYQRERALALLAEMKPSRVQPTAITYNIAMKACAAEPGTTLKACHLDSAFALFEEMQAADLVPDRNTYCTLIDLCAQARDGRRALALYKEMQARGVSDDVGICTALISACGSCGLVDEALAVFQTMVWGPRRKRPTRPTYLTLVRVCREHGRLKEALHVYNGMRRQKMAPSNAEFQQLTLACAEEALKADDSAMREQVGQLWGQLQGSSYIDLHGLSSKEARAAVLCVLADLQQRHKQGQPITGDLVIITGAGQHSDQEAGPKLRDAILHLLHDELHLQTVADAGAQHSAANLHLLEACAEAPHGLFNELC